MEQGATLGEAARIDTTIKAATIRDRMTFKKERWTKRTLTTMLKTISTEKLTTRGLRIATDKAKVGKLREKSNNLRSRSRMTQFRKSSLRKFSQICLKMSSREARSRAGTISTRAGELTKENLRKRSGQDYKMGFRLSL